MNLNNPTGLGEPVISGKRSLFLPPEPAAKPEIQESQNRHIRQKDKAVGGRVKRIRTTTELTPKALTVIQAIQQQHRLKTGKVLPLWKIISRALEKYGEKDALG